MIGDTIRDYRTRLKLTQTELGDKLGIHFNTIARWERGEVTPEHPELIIWALKGLAAEIRDADGTLAKLQAEVMERLDRTAAEIASWKEKG